MGKFKSGDHTLYSMILPTANLNDHIKNKTDCPSTKIDPI